MASDAITTPTQTQGLPALSVFAGLRVVHEGRGRSKPPSTWAYVLPPRRATARSFAGSAADPSVVNTALRTCICLMRPRTSVCVTSSSESGALMSMDWYSCQCGTFELSWVPL